MTRKNNVIRRFRGRPHLAAATAFRTAARTLAVLSLAAVLVGPFPCAAGPGPCRSGRAIPRKAGPEPAGPIVTLVENPAGLPAPFDGFVRKGDYMISDGTYTAFVAGTPRPVWSLGNYGHPEACGYLLGFVPAGASGRPWPRWS